MPLTAMSLSEDGLYLVTASLDKTVKIYDVVNFDMINIIKTSFVPSCAEFLKPRDKAAPTVAVGDKDSGVIRVFDSLGAGEVLHEVCIHKTPVRALRFSPKYLAVVSTDTAGHLEVCACCLHGCI